MAAGPPIPASPIPTAIRALPCEMSDGSTMIAFQIASSVGVATYFVAPEIARTLAENLMQITPGIATPTLAQTLASGVTRFGKKD